MQKIFSALKNINLWLISSICISLLVAIPIFVTSDKDWWPHISGFELLGPLLFLIIIVWLYKSVTE
jgi:hypothetical protein